MPFVILIQVGQRNHILDANRAYTRWFIVMCPMHSQHWTDYEISQWVSEWVSHSVTENELNALYRSQSFTYFYQSCRRGSVPGEVTTYCFWWKSGILNDRQTGSGINFYSAPLCKRCTRYGNSVCMSVRLSICLPVRPSVRPSITRRYSVKTIKDEKSAAKFRYIKKLSAANL